MQAPKKWKMALLVWLVIYPTITMINYTLGEWLSQFPMLIRTLVMSILLVPFMIFVAMPQITKRFNQWLIQ